MGNPNDESFIELPPYALLLMAKCMNRGLILTRKGEVREMRIDKVYKITQDCEVMDKELGLSHTSETQVKLQSLMDEVWQLMAGSTTYSHNIHMIYEGLGGILDTLDTSELRSKEPEQ